MKDRPLQQAVLGETPGHYRLEAIEEVRALTLRLVTQARRSLDLLTRDL